MQIFIHCKTTAVNKYLHTVASVGFLFTFIYGLTTLQVTQSTEGKKGKNSMCTMWKDIGSVEVHLHAFLISALD